MSKQIYIDSNGNEIQVSGTVNTADMMPMSGNDSTKVSEAIGDLTTSTTSVKSSLVGAVNEVDTKAKTVTSLGATITKATGVNDFEIGLYQNNKIISGYVAFTFSSNPSANATIATGFPIPKGMMQIPVACVYGSNLGKVGRIAINTSGNLQDWYSDTAFFKTGNTYVANLNYLKA